jgi:hypothetical protein
MATPESIKGCASTLPSTGKKPTFPNVDALTVAGVKIVSTRFCPVREMSL